MEPTQPILRCRYSYDPLDRLISLLQPDASAHQRFYCKSRLATEIKGATGFSVFQNNDLLLAQRKNQGGAIESTLLATDLQRSVLHTLAADQQQHPIAYSPYGHRQAESGLTSLLGFNGEPPDLVTGHYLLGNGYRAFNPVLMRFNSPDSLSPFGKGGLNPYAYCLWDPINNADPGGHFPISFWRSLNAHKIISNNFFKSKLNSKLSKSIDKMLTTHNNYRNANTDLRNAAFIEDSGGKLFPYGHPHLKGTPSLKELSAANLTEGQQLQLPQHFEKEMVDRIITANKYYKNKELNNLFVEISDNNRTTNITGYNHPTLKKIASGKGPLPQDTTLEQAKSYYIKMKSIRSHDYHENKAKYQAYNLKINTLNAEINRL
jgi:RHS repeat-associated protein